MLEGATLLVFADDWGVHPSSAQHLLRCFLGRNRVVWFNTVGLRLPRPTLRDGRKLLNKFGRWVGPNKPGPGGPPLQPEVVDLPLVPLQFGTASRTLNLRILRRAVRRTLEKVTSCDVALISTLPLTADLAGRIPGVTFVYYVVDDYASWPGLGGRRIRRMDQQQASKADLVVAASQELARLHAGRTRRAVEYLPHGVDVTHFSAARGVRLEKRRRAEPPLADVVFFGAIDERIDQELFAAVVASRPRRKFLCVGPGGRLSRRLRELPNLERRDAVPFAELPSLLGSCEAAILPYVGGEFGRRLAPLKAREALAAGLPIVASDVPELRPLGSGVHLAASAEEMASALDRVLTSPEKLPSLDDLAADSWEARAERFSEMLLAVRKERPCD